MMYLQTYHPREYMKKTDVGAIRVEVSVPPVHVHALNRVRDGELLVNSHLCLLGENITQGTDPTLPRAGFLKAELKT